jgi:hypothetical protein
MPIGVEGFAFQIVLSAISLFAGLWSRISDETKKKEQLFQASLAFYLISLVVFVIWVSSALHFA